jgi:cytochrome c oxidase subunit 4
MDVKTRRTVFMVPLIAWAGLLAGLAFNFAYARIPHAPMKAQVNLLVAALMLLGVLVVDMRLARASALVRLAALIGFVWLGFFFVLWLADELTR